MTKALTAFYDYLLPQLPGCTPALVDIELKEVLRDYCETSRCWREELAPIAAQAGVAQYPLAPTSSKTEVVGLLSMTEGAVLRWSASEPRLDVAQPVADVPAATYAPGQPPFAVSPDGVFITFDPPPTDTVLLTGWIRPQRSITSVPDFLFDEHLGVIRAGVLARLQAMGGKPWTDLQGAQRNEALYTARTHLHATNAARGRSRAPLRTRATLI